MPRLATHKLLMRPVFTIISFLILLPCMHSTDLDALLCLKSQLSDPSRALASWSNASLTPCDWQGVRCNTLNASRVVSLDLESLNLTGQIFPCVAELDFLDRIHMPDNHLNGHIPPDVGRLTRLTYLNLSMNSLGGAIPDTISSCSQLETISLESNSLEGEIPRALAECLLLRQIVLSNNNLQGSIPSRDSSTGVNKSSTIAGPRGSIGYIAPEYGMGCKISTEGDIYSYGIILLEMITGKHPTDDMFKDGMNLHNFVEAALSQELGEISEPSFITYDGEAGQNLLMAETKWCITRLAKLGLQCSEISAKSRPTIEDVYAEIVSIEEHFTSLQHRQSESTSSL